MNVCDCRANFGKYRVIRIQLHAMKQVNSALMLTTRNSQDLGLHNQQIALKLLLRPLRYS